MKRLFHILMSKEPAAIIGLVVSVLQCFQGGAAPEDAIPLAVGILIRFFVTPARQTQD